METKKVFLRLLQRIRMGIVCPVSEDKAKTVPLYESTFLWGAGSIFISVILVVIAAVKQDLRWLLILAWPFGILAVYAVLKGINWKRWLIVPCGVLIGFILLALNTWLCPSIRSIEQPRRSVEEKINQSPPQEVKVAEKEPKIESREQEQNRITQQRIELIKQWRNGIESISASEWYQHTGDDMPFRNTTWYSSLRQYMKREAIQSLERPRTIIAPRNSGEIRKKIILLDEVARIEKEWGLTGYSEQNYSQKAKFPTTKEMGTNAVTKLDLENMEKPLLDKMGPQIEASKDALERKYPLGYSLFASNQQNNFIPLNKEGKPDFSFDWENCRIVSINNSIVKVVLKHFHYYPNEIQIKNVGILLERKKGIVADGIFFNHIGLFVEIVDDQKDGIIYAVGFKKVEDIPKRGVDFNIQKYIIFQNIDISSIQ